ncbi:tyrosine-type recombinase/integrase, partial [Ruegeria pomeroyi]|uniref:tyrosine-type recombinase/integrase n=1 Tax=Ruegeria pomeroyi TaxID=89184 RepID=UPI001F351CC3
CYNRERTPQISAKLVGSDPLRNTVASPRVLAEKGSATLHSCRDTYATRMLNRGLSLGEVSHLLGHASIAQTQKYAKYDKKGTADKARSLLNGS